jgi:membrane protein
MLIIGAATVFLGIKDSINQIWQIRRKPDGISLRLLLNRLLSFSLIVGMGLLLLVSLVVSALLDLLSDKLSAIFSNGLVVIFIVINYILILAITSSLFYGIYRFLPDARAH